MKDHTRIHRLLALLNVFVLDLCSNLQVQDNYFRREVSKKVDNDDEATNLVASGEQEFTLLASGTNDVYV